LGSGPKQRTTRNFTGVLLAASECFQQSTLNITGQGRCLKYTRSAHSYRVLWRPDTHVRVFGQIIPMYLGVPFPVAQRAVCLVLLKDSEPSSYPSGIPGYVERGRGRYGCDIAVCESDGRVPDTRAPVTGAARVPQFVRSYEPTNLPPEIRHTTGTLAPARAALILCWP
jgi:hypothetical protein